VEVAGVDEVDTARHRLAEHRDRGGPIPRRPEHAGAGELHRAVAEAVHSAVAEGEGTSRTEVDHSRTLLMQKTSIWDEREWILRKVWGLSSLPRELRRGAPRTAGLALRHGSVRRLRTFFGKPTRRASAVGNKDCRSTTRPGFRH